jgi:hypothetical protein
MRVFDVEQSADSNRVVEIRSCLLTAESAHRTIENFGVILTFDLGLAPVGRFGNIQLVFDQRRIDEVSHCYGVIAKLSLITASQEFGGGGWYPLLQILDDDQRCTPIVLSVSRADIASGEAKNSK